MTIYSLHASRGKTQILATYQGSTAVTSSTVTSLAEPTLAEPIVDALNRVSALVTVPVSVFDQRTGRAASYPQTHLKALTDRTMRADLLTGTHSLWYENVCLLLHQALADLDRAVQAVPEPVGIAIAAELETEARHLHDALAEYSEAIPIPDADDVRLWDFGSPFVTYDGGMEALSRECRESLDRLEEGITAEQREQAVADLRVLAAAHSRCTSDQAVLELEYLTIFDEPYDSDRYFVNVSAPQPGDDGPDSWDIEISRWEPTDPDDEDCTSATGRPIVNCALSARPDAGAIADVLNLLDQRPELLTAWAKAPVGAALEGTPFAVTERYDT